MPLEQSLYDGDCYVFDRRTAVSHGLQQGEHITLYLCSTSASIKQRAIKLNTGVHVTCFNCRHPLTSMDLQAREYVEGVKCSYCAPIISDKQIKSSTERQRQIALAQERNEKHLGYRHEKHISSKNSFKGDRVCSSSDDNNA